ncbi:MAG: glycosyltransferase family 2 protein [Caldilineaceae bacterium]|nr:glycosyltransferase family 2 protein [Caldilineaceae bacterium]
MADKNTNGRTPRKPGKPVEIPPNTSRSNAVTTDETYGALRDDNRVVMRHSIALNLDSFIPATEAFAPRPVRDYPALRPATSPFFSVVIPNFNGQRHLAGLFAALDKQTFTDFEVLFADDASSDGSVDFVEANFPTTRVLTNRHNLGFVANINAACDAALGRVIVLLNNDTEPESDWLAELAQVICQHPDAAIVASKLLLYDQRTKIHTTGDLLGRDGIPRNRGVWEEDRGQFDSQTEIFGGCGGAMAVRKDVWQALGGFDDDFWMYLEDVDFAFRAQLAGWKAVFAPTARVYHKLSSSGGDDLSSFYVGRNTLWTIAKNMPTSLLLRHLPAIVKAQAEIAIDALRHGQGSAARARLRGQLAGLAGLPAQLRKRRTIQRQRMLEDAELERRLA